MLPPRIYMVCMWFGNNEITKVVSKEYCILLCISGIVLHTCSEFIHASHTDGVNDNFAFQYHYSGMEF